MFQVKDKNPALPQNPKKTKINNLPDKKYKALVIRMLNEFWKRIDKLSENFNKGLENIKKNCSFVVLSEVWEGYVC